MKKVFAILALICAAFVAGYSSAQTTSNFSVRWQFTGVDADIYQRAANGAIELDNVGRRKIQKSKVRPAFRSIVAAKVAEWADAGDIGELSGIQVQAITNQVKGQTKPVVQ